MVKAITLVCPPLLPFCHRGCASSGRRVVLALVPAAPVAIPSSWDYLGSVAVLEGEMPSAIQRGDAWSWSGGDPILKATQRQRASRVTADVNWNDWGRCGGAVRMYDEVRRGGQWRRQRAWTR